MVVLMDKPGLASYPLSLDSPPSYVLFEQHVLLRQKKGWR